MNIKGYKIKGASNGIILFLDDSLVGTACYNNKNEKTKFNNNDVANRNHTNIVDFETTKQYIEQAKRQGIEAELIALPDGKYEPQDYGMYIDKPIGNRYYNDELLNITVAIESVFSWISKYANPSI